MNAQILYFAAVRDLLGIDRESVDLPADVRTVGDFLRWLEVTHSSLRGRTGAVRIAKNEAFAREDELLAENDTLAVLPPLSGG